MSDSFSDIHTSFELPLWTDLISQANSDKLSRKWKRVYARGMKYSSNFTVGINVSFKISSILTSSSWMRRRVLRMLVT